MFFWKHTVFFLTIQLAAIAVISITCFPYTVAASEQSFAKQDIPKIRNILTWLDKNKLNNFHRDFKSLNSPLARKVGIWLWLNKGAVGGKFSLIANFLKVNPAWPHSIRFRHLAEAAITKKMPPTEIINWFNSNSVSSDVGRILLAEAYIASAKPDMGNKLIREAWIYGNFTKGQEKYIYKRYNKILKKIDHRDRLDRLLWEGRYWSSRRAMWKVNKSFQALGLARFSLRHRRGNVDKLITAIPENLKNDFGLLYERLRWRRRKNLDTSFDLLLKIPSNPPYVVKWWKERLILARKLIYKGNYAEAYKITSKHDLDSSNLTEYAEAEWISGWISLRFLHKKKIAVQHFKKMFNVVRFPVSRARGAYWVGRAIEKMGDWKQAKNWYLKAAQYRTTYYGQLALTVAGNSSKLAFQDTTLIRSEKQKIFQNNELVRVARLFSEIGKPKLVKSFIKSIFKFSLKKDWLKLTAQLCSDLGRLDLAVWVAREARKHGILLMNNGYPVLTPPPLHKNSTNVILEKPLVLSIIRQESAYDPRAISAAKARGLMQLIPITASRVAKKLQLPYSKKQLTQNPNYNMILGQEYLASLLKRYKGSYILALAAYNAGPSRIKRWIKNNGDPRDPRVDTIDWIELIPIKETRNYVQRVIENLQVYRSLSTENGSMVRINEDLNQSSR